MTGAVQGGAMAGYKMLDDQNKAALIAERDQALALKQENLQELKQVHDDQVQDKRITAAEDREDQREKNRIAAENRKAGRTVTDYEIDGVPQTQDQLEEAIKLKKSASDAKEEGRGRAESESAKEATVEGVKKASPTAREELDNSLGIKKPRKSLLESANPVYTEKEQAIIDKAENIKILNSKKVAKEEEREDKQEARQLEIEQQGLIRKEIAEGNNATAKAIAASKRDDKDAESTEKGKTKATVAAEKRLSQLDDIEARVGELSQAQQAERTRLERQVGRGPVPITSTHSSYDGPPASEWTDAKGNKVKTLESSVPAGYTPTGKTSGGKPVYFNPKAPKGKQYWTP